MCTADAECPAAPGACMVAVCAEGVCQHQVAIAGTVPGAQSAGDCQELICDGRGGTVPRQNLGDTPADDANACTDEVCSASGPEHASVAAGAKCAEAGVCNGKGRCGACVPEVRRCEKNAAQTCNEEGDWSPAVACDAGTPVCAAGRCAGITAMALGASHGCVLLDGGWLRCAGDAEVITGERPATVAGLAGASSLAVGAHHRCALLGDGTVRCWGDNRNGELGDGTREGRASPAAVLGVAGAAEIAAGDGHTCARLATGAVVCWGRDDKGQLGDAGTPPAPNPTIHVISMKCCVSSPPLRAIAGITMPMELRAIALGGATSCGLRSDGSVACWGGTALSADPSSPGKQVSPGAAPKPRAVTGLKNVAAIALGFAHSCALLQDATATCWGDNEKGQLGDGSPAKKHAPAKVKGLAGAASLALGRDHTCALLGDGTVQCWGSNAAGQLGDGSTTDRRVPGPVPGLAGVAAIVSAGQRTCARLGSGAVLCWGDDADSATGGARPTPTAVTW